MTLEIQTPDQIRGLSRDELHRIQARKLRSMLEVVGEKNEFYRRKFSAAGVDPAEVREPEDLRRLPFTTKSELASDQEDHPPYGTILTYPVTDYTRLHQTSGTKGRPLRWLDTPESWNWMLSLWDVIYDAAGVRPHDRFFFPFSFGPFLGFWAGFDAAQKFGHLTLPGGAMNTLQRLRFMIENEANVVACTPTYALHLAEVAAENDIDLAAAPVRIVIVAGEPGGNIPETKARIADAWGAGCFDHSGMTEIGALGFECRENQGGLHLTETECIAEVIDPKTEEPAAPGTVGELVLTNLGRWGSPLLRYRTGDLVAADTQPCSCGRSLIRLKGGILGRVDDMVIVRGNNLYPAALESVLRRFPEVVEYQAEVSIGGGLATLSLTVETTSGLGSNSRSLSDRIASAVKEAFSFQPEVSVVKPGTLPRFELKASRFTVKKSDER